MSALKLVPIDEAAVIQMFGKRLLTVSEVAQITGLGSESIRRLKRDNKLLAFNHSTKPWLFDVSEVWKVFFSPKLEAAQPRVANKLCSLKIKKAMGADHGGCSRKETIEWLKS